MPSVSITTIAKRDLLNTKAKLVGKHPVDSRIVSVAEDPFNSDNIVLAWEERGGEEMGVFELALTNGGFFPEHSGWQAVPGMVVLEVEPGIGGNLGYRPGVLYARSLGPDSTDVLEATESPYEAVQGV